MFKGDPAVIRTKLRLWEGPNGLKRYYYDRWPHYCNNGELVDYYEKYRIDPQDFKLGIKVFFDGEGVLNITQCHDLELKTFLEKKMIGWYCWAEGRCGISHTVSYKIWDLIEPYVRTLKPGFYQVRYQDRFFNFDSQLHAHLNFTGYVEKNLETGEYSVDTGYPDFDELIRCIMDDYDTEEGSVKDFFKNTSPGRV